MIDMTASLSPDQARGLRHGAQLLGGSPLSPREVVDRAVALQGQDLPAVLRAIALRSAPGTTVDDVRAAFDSGALVRSWPMRGTLFATTPEHLASLLALTGTRTLQSMARRREQLELDDATIDRAHDVAVAALETAPLRRADILATWEDAGISTDGGRGYHLLVHLCISGLAHWGAFTPDGSEQYLTLTATQRDTDTDAALSRIVAGYVAARGPVTLDDLAWWTKLPKTGLRAAAASVDGIELAQLGEKPVYLGAETSASSGSRWPDSVETVTLVPAFDEWILGYADRSLVASDAMFDALVPGKNGVFRPAVLVDAAVVGTWRFSAPRGAKNRTPVAELLEPVSKRTVTLIDDALSAWPHD
ncbi:MAG: hypothetical protein BGO47_08180 [Microbacterium sp. 67-17]|nr:MAG: hypothetical protein BGO47_08180 [Microbacterium sp. 67-17]